VKLVTPPPEPEFFSNEYETLQILTISTMKRMFDLRERVRRYVHYSQPSPQLWSFGLMEETLIGPKAQSLVGLLWSN